MFPARYCCGTSVMSGCQMYPLTGVAERWY
jgi:hypothetical protein